MDQINRFMTDFEKYRNKDGTYTSPKNGKVYKNITAFRSHWYYKTSDHKFSERIPNCCCVYCKKVLSIGNIVIHSDNCYLNPKNLRLCVVCGSPIKNFKTSKGTCSHSCSNTYFKKVRYKPEKYKSYRTICFAFHRKECIICGEDKIVAVHHYDNNHHNDDPSNLVPLCPTHHAYVHSSYKELVSGQIDKYIEEWKNNNLRVG